VRDQHGDDDRTLWRLWTRLRADERDGRVHEQRVRHLKL
jgi:hypothetical protein